jgi:DNA-binding IscR family transcriptional regulator
MPDSSELAPEIRKFIDQFIKSIAELEVLLFLNRNKAQAWTANEMSQEMRSNLNYAETILRELQQTGLLQEEQKSGAGAYRLSTNRIEELKILSDLDTAYQSRRISVINQIYQSSNEKLRGFAEAFKIRK